MFELTIAINTISLFEIIFGNIIFDVIAAQFTINLYILHFNNQSKKNTGTCLIREKFQNILI